MSGLTARLPTHLSAVLTLAALAMLFPLLSGAQEGDSVPRLANGRPDLSGTYDLKTLTPLERPQKFGNNLYLTREEAEAVEREWLDVIEAGSKASDPNREAPEEGGAAPVGFADEQRETLGAGNVGGYNSFWVDRGDSVIEIDGRFRTSILTSPENGRKPPLTKEALASRMKLRKIGLFEPNDGTAFWLDKEGPGPYDDIEMRPFAERCLMSFASTVPALPSLYNNFKRIVQTDNHVLILNEMVHDVRVVRIGGEHPPAEVRKWWGDSVGHWEGDTLVVDTTNFLTPIGAGTNRDDLHVVERFTRWDEDTLHYEFTVDEGGVRTGTWSGDFIWPRTDNKVFEYACHEGNYAMGGIMRGARLLEEEARAAKGESP